MATTTVALIKLSFAAFAKDAADPLSLRADSPAARIDRPALKAFAEFSSGAFRDRSDPSSTRGTTRLTMDGRFSGNLDDSWQSILSARVDALNPEDARASSPTLSLREAYLSRQDSSGDSLVDFGRIVVRDGPGYGYNPTDFFRDNVLRVFNTQDPLSLRENRLGSVMLRAQRLWNGGSLAVSLSPKVSSAPSRSGLSLDLGATNRRQRGLLALSTTWSERVSSQLLLYREESLGWSLGASATALVGEAVVLHGEVSDGPAPGADSRGASAGTRAAVGLTATLPTKLSVTAEYHHNSSALDRAGWNQALASGMPPLAGYYVAALALQDSGSRHAWMLYAVQRDLLVKNLELRALYRSNRSDSSSMRWIEVRYRMPGGDVGLQYLRNSGRPASEFGLPVARSTASIVAAVYF